MSDPRLPTLDQVCANAVRLPSAPALLPRLATVLQQENSTADDVREVIELDSALAASTLRLANSAYFGGRAVDTLDLAIIRLGQKEIYRLAALALVNRWETGFAEALGREPGDFCRHALCTALGAEVLAEKTGRVEPQVAYTAGLVADLGKLALLHSCAPFYPAVRACCEQQHCSWEKAEKSVLGYDHTEAGTRLLKQWRFPAVFVQAAEFQLRPAAAPADARPLIAHVQGGKYVATSMGPGVAEEEFLTTIDGDFLREWDITSERLEEAMPEVLERAARRLGDRLTHGAVNL
jgi:HD-like signal output (HDOD) protein